MYNEESMQKVTHWTTNFCNRNIRICVEFPPRNTLVLHFDDPQRKKVRSSSTLEANALDRAAKELKDLPEARDITYILKVTGRYFLEGVEEQFSRHAVLCSPILLVQTHRKEQINWQNSEYFGIRKDGLDLLLLAHRVLQSGQHMEESLFILSNLFGYTQLGPGFTNSQPRGGDGLVINPL